MLKRFWDKVDKSPGLGPYGDCWEWVAASKSGEYGSFRYYDKCIFAHRYAYQEHNNEILVKGDCVCHTCDNPKCVRPSHLFKADHLTNMADRANKGRQPKGEDHRDHKLTEVLIRQAYKDRLNGVPLSHLAKDLNVAYSTLYDALSGRNWKHLNFN